MTVFLIKDNTSFLAADQFTLADVIFFIHLAFAVRSGFTLDRYPKLSK
jgi:glutathione S-transferase